MFGCCVPCVDFFNFNAFISTFGCCVSQEDAFFIERISSVLFQYVTPVMSNKILGEARRQQLEIDNERYHL